jgi:Chalcone isomerase-like
MGMFQTLKTVALISILALCTFPHAGQAATLAQYQAKTALKVGDTRLTWFIWDVYDASLFTPTGTYAAGNPLVLELTYLRSLDGGKVAAKTVEEMRRLGYKDEAQLARWQLVLTDWFGGIKDQTKLAGMLNQDGTTTFVKDGKQVLGTIKDLDFAPTFFGIWLSERTLRPDLRDELLKNQRKASL